MSEITRIEDEWSWRQSCCKMTVDNSITFKKPFNQLHYWYCNIQQRSIWYKNSNMYAIEMLKRLSIAFTIASNGAFAGSTFSKNNGPTINNALTIQLTLYNYFCRIRRYWCMRKWLFHLLYPTVFFFEMEIVFVCLQNIPWPFIASFCEAKKL